jgi:hypothetical protein
VERKHEHSKYDYVQYNPVKLVQYYKPSSQTQNLSGIPQMIHSLDRKLSLVEIPGYISWVTYGKETQPRSKRRERRT